MVNFKIYDVTDCTANNYNTWPYILRSKGNQTKIWSINTTTWEIIFLKNRAKNGVEASPRPLNSKIKFKIEHISGSAVWNFIKFVFNVCSSQSLSKYI